VGTGSLRRSSQLLNKRPDLDITPIRGNVDTRIKRLESGEFDAIILAAAGLNRLGLSSKITELLSPPEYIPAVGQGALGIEVRDDDGEVRDILEFLNHHETAIAVKAERAFLRRLEGGCQVPLGAYGFIDNGKIVIHGMVSELDGRRVIKESLIGHIEQPEQTGKTLAERLLEMGADRILAEVYGS
jgi:hydroxymethylbilane synthase